MTTGLIIRDFIRFGFLKNSSLNRSMVTGNAYNTVRVDLLDYGITLGLTGSMNYTHPKFDWYISDEKMWMLLPERKITNKSKNITGEISFKPPDNILPVINFTYNKDGSGDVTISKVKRRKALFEFIDNMPNYENNLAPSSSTKLTWRQTTAFVDKFISINDGTSKEYPKYHIYSYQNFYGPTGYWVTNSAININYDEVMPLEFYVNSTETQYINYRVLNNGLEIYSGTAEANTVIVIPTWDFVIGANVCTVVLADSNGKSMTMAGPTIDIIQNAKPVGEFITQSGQYRAGKKVVVSFSIFDADLDHMNWILYNNGTKISEGTSSTGITIDHNLLLAGMNTFTLKLNDPFRETPLITGPTIKIVDWKQTNAQ